ncbi:MAG: hypothetical protein IJV35_10765 [Neisseriaceae bacterium]|nr:hypothetical protein [Neisseriaceae bacterium]
MNATNTHTTKSVPNAPKILLGKNLQASIMTFAIFFITCMVSIKTIDTFFAFRLPETGLFSFVIIRALSILISSGIFFLIVWYGVKSVKTKIINPKKIALNMAVILAFVEIVVGVSKMAYLTIPNHAIVRLLLLIAFYLFVGIYFLLGIWAEKNFRQPENF